MTVASAEDMPWNDDKVLAEQIALHLKALRLPSARRNFLEMYALAQKRGWSPLNWFNAILEHEVVERGDRQRLRRRQESNLLPGKTLETFNFKMVQGVKKIQIESLCRGGDWISHAENVLVFGPSGCGKTHLASAIGHGLVDNGYRVLYQQTGILLQRLQEAKRDCRLPAFLEKLERYDVVMVDDIGYADKQQADTGLLFDLIADRYESRSLLVASNKSFSQWDDVFPDNARCVAAIDRLVHHSTILELTGESYRRKIAEGRVAK